MPLQGIICHYSRVYEDVKQKYLLLRNLLGDRVLPMVTKREIAKVMAAIGSKGGKSKSARKREASAQTLAKIRHKRWPKKVENKD